MSGDDRQNSPSISRQNRPSATHINGMLGNDNYRKAINHLKNIQELSEKIDGIPWNALFTEKVTDKTTVE